MYALICTFKNYTSDILIRHIFTPPFVLDICPFFIHIDLLHLFYFLI